MADAGVKVIKSPRTVLLVCANDTTTTTLATILTQNGETALTASNPKDGWDCLKSGAVACVVYDLTASGLESLAFFRAVRSSVAFNAIPLLFLVKKDFKIPVLDRIGPETARDSWLALPCSGQLFLTAVRSLLEQKLRETQSIPRVPVEPAAAAALAPAAPAAPTGSGSGATPGADSSSTSVAVRENMPVLSGQLGALDVTKILSMLEPLRLTGELKVSDGKRGGGVYFVEGAVHHAELNDIEGPDALFLLFHLKAGTFRFDTGAPTTKRTIEGNTMQLLLEGLRQMDEAKALVKAFQERRATQTGVHHLEAPTQ